MSKGCNFHVSPFGIIDNDVSHYLNISFTLLALWIVALSSTNKVLHFKPKNEYFLQTSYIHLNIMFSLFHAFSCQYANSLLLSTLINFYKFFSVFLPSFALKINKGANFCPEARAVKIVVIFSFLVLVFLYLLS